MPPLTRMANANESVRQFAKFSDPIAALTALAAYATRSLLERAQVLAEDEPPPDTRPIAPAGPVPSPETTQPQPPRQAGNFEAPAPGQPPGTPPAPVDDEETRALQQEEWQVAPPA